MPPASHLHYQCVKITLVSFFVVHWQHAYHQISASLQKMEVHVNSVTYTCSLNKIPKQINIMKQTHNFNQNFALHFLNNKKNTCYTTANMHVVTYIAYITKQYITKPEKFHIELNQKLLIYFVLYTILIWLVRCRWFTDFTYTPVKCESSTHILPIPPGFLWHHQNGIDHSMQNSQYA